MGSNFPSASSIVLYINMAIVVIFALVLKEAYLKVSIN